MYFSKLLLKVIGFCHENLEQTFNFGAGLGPLKGPPLAKAKKCANLQLTLIIKTTFCGSLFFSNFFGLS